MSKPTHWVVFVTDKDTNETTEHEFTERARARGFMVIQKAQGHTCRITGQGF